MQRIRDLGVTLTLAALVVGGLLASPASAATTGPATIFNSIPKTLPGNVPSVGFEATSTSEFGDYARFAGKQRRLQRVIVVMSSWGCEEGTWNAGTCSTTPGATFSHPITLTLYGNPGNGAVGTELAHKTQTFAIPYRPSASAACGDGRWQAANGTCYNGLATKITFDFSGQGVILPNSVIFGISYNTTHYGDTPITESAPCFAESGGCGYDALNVSAASTTPRKGIDDDVNGIFQDSDWSGAYCDNGQTGTFRLDTSCWTGFNPMVRFAARR
jgi:hypothetical protein